MTVRSRSAGMRGWLQSLSARVYTILGSPRFLYVVVGLLVFQALWIALTARYPQAFDEQFHFGLIQLHAHQWLPFFTYQPAGAEVHGAVVRDPSYFYHYLMSLPYRLITLWVHSQMAQVIILRLINIGLFAAGLPIYRALMIRLGLSRRLIHTVLLFFVLTPVVPLLAAHINYDNLIFPLTAAFFLCAVRFMQALEQQHTIDVATLMLMLLFGLVAALAKFTTLPVTAATIIILAYVALRRYRQGSTEPEKFQMVWPGRLFLMAGGIVIIGLLCLGVERYGINLVRYHALAPACDKVISQDLCHSYAVWERDYQWSQIYPHPSTWGIVVYPVVWFHRMVFETMFTIASYFDANGIVQYIPAPPLTVANYTAWVLVIIGLACCVLFWKRLWGQRYLRYLLIVSLFYAIALFADNFLEYMSTGEAVAIHGRYLVPVYPLLYAAVALAFGYLFEHFHRPKLKVGLVIISLLFLSQGAGLITWIFRSDPTWYWSQDPHSLVYEINRPVQTVVHRIVIP